MGIEELSELDVVHGIFTLIFVIISLLVGLRILLKSFEISSGRRVYIAVCIAWMGISTPWFGNSFSFLLFVLGGYRLELVPYLFLENAFIPLAIMCWIYAFSSLVYPNSVKKMAFIFGVICIAFEIYLIVNLVINPENIGTLEGNFDSSHTILPNLFKVFGIFIVLITGVIFANKSMNADDKSTQWKGRFLLIAMISFTVGAFLDVVLDFTPIELILVRLLLISSAIEYYLGFFLPKFVAKRLLKES